MQNAVNNELIKTIIENGEITDVLNEMLKKTVYSNRPYELPAFPLIIRNNVLQEVAKITGSYIKILNKIISLYQREDSVRSFFSFSPNQRKLIESSYVSNTAGIGICRLDGYIRKGGNEYYILENNTDCPAGTLFTSRINTLINDAGSGKLQDSYGLEIPFWGNQEDHIVDIFKKIFCKESGGRTLKIIAILQRDGKVSNECKEIAKIVNGHDITSIIADPNELSFGSEGVFVNGEKIDFIWNKINSVEWDKHFTDNSYLVENIAKHICDKNVIHANNFAARYITESKLCHAFLFEESSRKYFAADEIALIEKILPRTRRINPEDFADDPSLIDTFIEEKNNLVLKDAYDIRGDGVTIGKDVDAKEWRDLIVKKGGVIQEYITPETLFIDEPLNFSLDVYFYGSDIWSFGSKISKNNKINIFQGGRKISVWGGENYEN